MAALQAGHSGTGMRTQALRDLDYVNPRQPLRKTALPPEVQPVTRIATLRLVSEPFCAAAAQDGTVQS